MVCVEVERKVSQQLFRNDFILKSFQKSLITSLAACDIELAPKVHPADCYETACTTSDVRARVGGDLVTDSFCLLCATRERAGEKAHLTAEVNVLQFMVEG